MRYRNNLWSALMASVCTLLLYACTGGYDDIEIMNNGAQGSTDSRAATPVTASVALTETNRLETQLAAALGSEAHTVQELTISGIFYEEDVEHLHTLKALEKLDMTNVTIRHNNEHPNYTFSYSYTTSYGGDEGYVTDYLDADAIGSQMFKGMTSLKEYTMPTTVNTIKSKAFTGCTSLKSIHIPDNIQRIGWNAFSSCPQLQSLTIPKTVTQIDGNIVENCPTLHSLIWNTTHPVTGWKPNDNCFLYINSNNGVAATYDANVWTNGIIDGVAENIRLSFSANESTQFHCPIAFTAKRISLTMDFRNWIWTYEGKASGWRTLTLPFNVTSITSEEKGTLAPFGSQVAGAKPFWLRRLTADGFVDVTSIEADQPYIIAMPNNPNLYLDEYNISGNVVFEGENVSIPVTPDKLPAVEGPDYYLQPTYRFVGKDRTVYALNYEYNIRGYEQGGVFAHTSTPVYAYEAYVKEKPGSTTRAYYGIDTRSSQTRNVQQKNTSGIPAVGDM